MASNIVFGSDDEEIPIPVTSTTVSLGSNDGNTEAMDIPTPIASDTVGSGSNDNVAKTMELDGTGDAKSQPCDIGPHLENSMIPDPFHCHGEHFLLSEQPNKETILKRCGIFDQEPHLARNSNIILPPKILF